MERPVARVPVVPAALLVCLPACVTDLSSLLSDSGGTTLPATQGNGIPNYIHSHSVYGPDKRHFPANMGFELPSSLPRLELL